MRDLIDACVDPRAAKILTGHDAHTTHEMGWHRLKDHELLRLVQERFDVFLTTDQGFEFEHNLRKLRFGIVIIHVETNKIEFYQALRKELVTAIERVEPGEVVHVRPDILSREGAQPNPRLISRPAVE